MTHFDRACRMAFHVDVDNSPPEHLAAARSGAAAADSEIPARRRTGAR
jgi:hypothetical protein